MCELTHTRRNFGPPNGGLPVIPDTFTNAYRVEITRIVIVFGPLQPIIFGARATYVHRIIKDAKPRELPDQVIRVGDHLKTVKALGLTVPPTLLTADQVIE
jgi:hypothetical protein